MGDTNIEWTRNADGTAGKTWNPIRARSGATGKVGWFCEHVSEGCRNCYAEKMNRNTYFGNGLDYKPAVLDQVEIFLDEKILQQPLHWRKPTNVFPCSMTDLFGRWVKDEWLDKVHHVMWRASQHTFQVLTKRADRMLDYMGSPNTPEQKALPNVWLGVSVEDQKTADERIPLLLQTPAAIRWISAEPLLGPVDLTHVDYSSLLRETLKESVRFSAERKGKDVEAAVAHAAASIPDSPTLKPGERPVLHVLNGNWFDGWDSGGDGKRLDWVVVGGESGPNARPMHPDWARSLRDQCVAAGVPFFFKQWGEHVPGESNGCGHDSSDGAQGPVAKLVPQRVDVWRCNICSALHGYTGDDQPFDFKRVGKKAAGRLLDGREWNEYPKAKAVAA